MIKITRICDDCKREFSQLTSLILSEVTCRVKFVCSHCLLARADQIAAIEAVQQAVENQRRLE